MPPSRAATERNMQKELFYQTPSDLPWPHHLIWYITLTVYDMLSTVPRRWAATAEWSAMTTSGSASTANRSATTARTTGPRWTPWWTRWWTNRATSKSSSTATPVPWAPDWWPTTSRWRSHSSESSVNYKNKSDIYIKVLCSQVVCLFYLEFMCIAKWSDAYNYVHLWDGRYKYQLLWFSIYL